MAEFISIITGWWR